MSTYLVLTVIGDDKPGLVEMLADTVARHSGNWLESNMSHLAGKFAGILRVSVADAHADALIQDLQKLSSALKLVVEKVRLSDAPTRQRSLRLLPSKLLLLQLSAVSLTASCPAADLGTRI